MMNGLIRMWLLTTSSGKHGLSPLQKRLEEMEEEREEIENKQRDNTKMTYSLMKYSN
jgi:uncharacterized membrane protein (DUF106 family)